jgi:hypothetical protein
MLTLEPEIAVYGELGFEGIYAAKIETKDEKLLKPTEFRARTLKL